MLVPGETFVERLIEYLKQHDVELLQGKRSCQSTLRDHLVPSCSIAALCMHAACVHELAAEGRFAPLQHTLLHSSCAS